MSITTALFLALIGVAVVVAVKHMRADNSSEGAGVEPYFDMADSSICDTSFSGHSSGHAHDHSAGFDGGGHHDACGDFGGHGDCGGGHH